MILDYNYNSNKKNLSISYIKENGAKQVLNFNVERFKSYYKTPTGKFTNWDGSKCDVRWTERPHRFDIRNYITELPEQYQKLLRGKTNPKLYTFDIETLTRLSPDDVEEFPDPTQAKFPITTISIVSPECNVMILGTRPLGPGGDALLQSRFEEYINNLEYFHELGLPMPKIKYVVFPSEESMLRYFLEKIVAIVPVLAGWNSILFDWQYIQNRCKFYFPNIWFGMCSMNKTLTSKNYTDQRQEKVRLSIPCHTLVLDMMDVIENFDYVVMPIKESMSLDFVAGEMIHSHKIEYDGSLDDLYRGDYDRYVFYNGIDSLLVQLLDKKFKTMQNIYAQALYCNEMIGKCFSKIALSEAMFWDYFYKNGIKVVPEEKQVDRGRLLGAYVRIPTPGKHKFVCCNDFASLYPSTIRTTNISVENYVGAYWDDAKLDPYRADPVKYIVVGPEVYKNKGSLEKPELGDYIGKFLNDEKLDLYRKDPNYFVSVTGCVFKNDKDYAFRIIQTQLAQNRNRAKYLYKKMDATVMNDTKHILDGKVVDNKKYPDDVVKGVDEIGYHIENTGDLLKMCDELKEFSIKLHDEIEYLSSYEQAVKYIMNSLYGGSSHIAFFWFHMNLANCITAEARNIIHIMMDHIPQWFQNNWYDAKELHKKLGITVKKMS
jgi:DNA polymerase elongation subunit (family B)